MGILSLSGLSILGVPVHRFANKKILLAVTGGIAAYKACELLRRLQDEGADVRVVMTPSATEFVSPMTFAALSGHAVFFRQKEGQSESAFQHIDYPRWAEDLLLVAPASANSIARFANGLADEPVSQCFLASLAPKLVVPAMNFAMWESPATQRNLSTLQQDGIHLISPESGRLACGEMGLGRFPSIASIVEYCAHLLTPPSPRNGRRVLITVGRTEEAIDPVRIITNKSSGKTGVAIAEAFYQKGWQVCVIAGPMDVPYPANCEVIPVRSALEMHQATLERLDSFHAFVFCAAVADYRPKHPSDSKIKESRSQLTLELEPNPNILRDVVQSRKKDQVVVGFALETHEAMQHGKEKLLRSGANLLVLNTPVRKESGFGKDEVEYTLLHAGSDSFQDPSLGSKEQLALDVVSAVEAISL